MIRMFQFSLAAVFVVFQIITNAAHAEESPECGLLDLYDFSETKNLSKVDDSMNFILTYEYSIVPCKYNYANEAYEKTIVNNLEETDDVFNAIKVKLEYQGEGWLGTGLSGSDKFMRMIGGQVVIAKPEVDEGPSNPGKYILNSKYGSSITTLMQPNQQTLIDASYTQTPLSTILEYTKILEEDGERSIKINEENRMIYAVGNSNLFQRHMHYGQFMINPGASCAKWLKNKPIDTPDKESEEPHNSSSSQVLTKESEELHNSSSTQVPTMESEEPHNSSSSQVPTKESEEPHYSSSSQVTLSFNKGIWIAHGVFAALAWAIAAPLAVMVAILRYKLTKKGTYEPDRKWFVIHFYLNIACVIFTFISLVLAIIGISEDESRHFNEPHKLVGLLIFLFVCLQALFAMARPDAGNSLEDGRKSTKWIIWNYSHRILGISLIGTAIWQIQSGLYHYSEHFGVSTKAWTYVFYSWVGLLVIVVNVTKLKGRICGD